MKLKIKYFITINKTFFKKKTLKYMNIFFFKKEYVAGW